jgi:hypothetical protein
MSIIKIGRTILHALVLALLFSISISAQPPSPGICDLKVAASGYDDS